MIDAIIERLNDSMRFITYAALGVAFGYGVYATDVTAQELTPATVQNSASLNQTPSAIDTILDGLVTKSKPEAPRLSRSEARSLPPVPSDAWKARYGKYVIEAARSNNLSPNLVMAVIAIESGFNPQARNSASIGLMQIQYRTARGYGLERTLGPSALFNPATNIRVATNYLGAAYKLANGNVCKTISLYNRGLGSRGISTEYCAKARRVLRYADYHIE
jgi:soluble lytic murein transglycosylase-like protein